VEFLSRHYPHYSVILEQVKPEGPDLVTFHFQGADLSEAHPGQFLMLTIPGLDEKPFSILEAGESGFAVTVKKVGPFTDRLFQAPIGQRFLVRGPLGRGFTIRNGNILLVAGGFAAPPLLFLARVLKEQSQTELTTILGARSAQDLLYREEFHNLSGALILTTDDGSTGRSGTTIEVLQELLPSRSFDAVYLAGPEAMLARGLSVLKNYPAPVELAIERYFKCGVGLCGSCVLDPSGLITCVEGPVFSREQLLASTDFGQAYRDATGRKVYFRSQREPSVAE